jgi:hypothetical protein
MSGLGGGKTSVRDERLAAALGSGMRGFDTLTSGVRDLVSLTLDVIGDAGGREADGIGGIGGRAEGRVAVTEVVVMTGVV